MTDYLDGYYARIWDQQSAFGRMLDPIADKLLVGAAILMLVHFDRSPILPAKTAASSTNGANGSAITAARIVAPVASPSSTS